MEFEAEIQATRTDPQALEQLYQVARQQGQREDFRLALVTLFEQQPQNLLYAAWYYRLRDDADDAEERPTPLRNVNWLVAVPLSIVTGLVFWALSDVEELVVSGSGDTPHLFLWWAPLATLSALVYLALTARTGLNRNLMVGAGLLAMTGYTIVATPFLNSDWKTEQILVIAALHLPLLCWFALGFSVLGTQSTPAADFAFIIKSIEVGIIAGLYLAAGMAFGGIMIGMFEALGIQLPEIWLRMIAAGGFGLLPVMAVASVYDPAHSPADQDFEHGLSPLIATMMRLLIPLTLGVLAVYLLVIPFYFQAPYDDREVLLVYNLMQFGIIGLLVGATPWRGDQITGPMGEWLRRGILSVAVLATLVSLYALSAIVYRILEWDMTPNRLVVLGWNVINLGVLGLLIYRQFTEGRKNWVASLQAVYSLGLQAYLAWSLLVLISFPVIFG
ncbi:MAG: hypothetical protein GYB65_14095 [Chloroflexi bacterium]|nr:hypothetical protein [Chloroflexota bacterium]